MWRALTRPPKPQRRAAPCCVAPMRTGKSPRASRIDIASRSLLAVSEPELRTPAADRASKRNSAISLSRPLHHNVTRGDAGHFVDRRDSLPHLAPAIGSQGDHAVFQGFFANRPGVDTLHHHFAD